MITHIFNMQNIYAKICVASIYIQRADLKRKSLPVPLFSPKLTMQSPISLRPETLFIIVYLPLVSVLLRATDCSAHELLNFYQVLLIFLRCSSSLCIPVNIYFLCYIIIQQKVNEVSRQHPRHFFLCFY